MATYDEVLVFRTLLKSFPEEAKIAISDLWNRIDDLYVDFEKEIKKIAETYGITQEKVESYYDWYATDQPSKVVVFYNEQKWFDGEPCCDSRWNNDLLPRGSVPCAFITEQAVVVRAPYLKGMQLDQFKSELQQALIDIRVLTHTADDVILNGAIVF